MDKSPVTLERMRTFVRVAERGSLSAVAHETGVGQSTITRHLSELEHALGSRLLSRTTRCIALTEEGRRYLGKAKHILSLVEQAADEVRADGESGTGTVRVSGSVAFGVAHLCRLLFAFQDRHPGIEIDLNLTDERIDLVREGVDLAVRLGPLVDSTLKVRSLGVAEFVLAASSTYLRDHPRPETPDDLSRHKAIRKANVSWTSGVVLQGPNGSRHTVAFDGPLRVDSGLAAREALLAGRGIAFMPYWLVSDLIGSGKIEVLLPGYTLPPMPISLVLQPAQASITRVATIADFLAGEIRRLMPTLPERR